MSWLIEAKDLVPRASGSGPQPKLNLQLSTAGIYCLIGLNGPTLDRYLRAVGGILPLRQGRLRLLGHKPDDLDADAWTQLRIKLGYISRGAPLLSVISGIENVLLPSIYHGKYSRTAALAQAERLLGQLQFDGDANLLPAYLSDLQRTQLSLARTVMLEPAALLLNDPHYGLEPQECGVIDKFLLAWGQQRALLLASGNLYFVRNVANRILLFTEQEVFDFAGWEALCQSADPKVHDYLRRYHEHYVL